MLTEDRVSKGVNRFTGFPITYSTASRWRWYYAGSAIRLRAVSKTFTR